MGECIASNGRGFTNFVSVLEFVVRDFLSNKALLLPDLYKKFEDLVDKTALIKSLKEPKDKIGEKSSNFLYKSGNNKALLDKKSLTTNSKTG
jgi:hypothetical protein